MDELYFSNNFKDQSVQRGGNAGFQFDFFCQRCRDVWRSPFVPFQGEQASNLLNQIGGFTGGILSRAGGMAEQFAQAGYGKAHDEALKSAIELAQAHFQRCGRCTHYVCPRCWNEQNGLCLECAPDIKAEVEVARASGEVSAATNLARQEGDRLGQMEDVKTQYQLVCPKCKAKTTGGKFCPECGAPLNVSHKCSCGAEVPSGAKFCPNCGAKAN
jgi:hypothetical protein